MAWDRAMQDFRTRKADSVPADSNPPPTKVPKLLTSSTTASSGNDTNTSDTSPASPELPGPPLNFGEVCAGIFRSSFPKPANFDFLRGLRLRTILTLISDPYPEANQEFMLSNGIMHIQIPIPPNKDTFDSIPLASMERALNVLMDHRNHPILVHCNKGKHRTGCVIGCLRKISDWTMGSIVKEYRSYALHKARPLDEKYIELFDENAMRTAIGDGLTAVFRDRRPLLTPGSSPVEDPIEGYRSV